MKNKNRVLGYQKAITLSEEILKEVSGGGGSEKNTVHSTHKMTGFPGPMDVEFDHITD